MSRGEILIKFGVFSRSDGEIFDEMDVNVVAVFIDYTREKE